MSGSDNLDETRNMSNINPSNSKLPYGIFGNSDSGLILWGTTSTKRKPIITGVPEILPKKTVGRLTCEKCDKTPSFSPYGEKPKRCGIHRYHDDVNTRHKICEAKGCLSRARFGLKGQRVSRCSKHCMDDDRDLSSRSCVFPGCTITPSFCETGKTKAIRCATHRTETDVIAKKEMCGMDNCIKRPLFISPINDVKHCIDHYVPGEDRGIMYTICQKEGCTKHATFSITKNKPLWCVRHKQIGDRDVVNKSCEVKNCFKRPSFAPKGMKAARCKNHCNIDDINVVAKRCGVEKCNVVIDTKKVFCKSHMQ